MRMPARGRAARSSRGAAASRCRLLDTPVGASCVLRPSSRAPCRSSGAGAPRRRSAVVGERRQSKHRPACTGASAPCDFRTRIRLRWTMLRAPAHSRRRRRLGVKIRLKPDPRIDRPPRRARESASASRRPAPSGRDDWRTSSRYTGAATAMPTPHAGSDATRRLRGRRARAVRACAAAGCRSRSPRSPGLCSMKPSVAGLDRRALQGGRTKTTSATWTAASHSTATRSRAGTCGWSGPAATTASGTASPRISLGTLDFLKTLSSHPSMHYSRRQPLQVSRPGQRALLHRRPQARTRPATASGSTCAIRTARPIRSPTPRSTRASQIGARGKTVPVGSYYGEPSGIVGLRLFPNPDFDEDARRKWDSERYYRDPTTTSREIS